MTDSETEEEGWDVGSGGQSEECHDEVVVVETSGDIASVNPSLCSPERNKEDTP